MRRLSKGISGGLCLLMAAGCGSSAPKSDGNVAEEAVGSQHEAVVLAPATQNLALNSVLPQGLSVAQVGLSAADAVTIRDRAKVADLKGAPATVAALSSAQSQFGQDSKVGNVYA